MHAAPAFFLRFAMKASPFGMPSDSPPYQGGSKCHSSNSVKYFLNEGIYGVLILRIHFCGVAIGYYHAARHSSMSQNRCEASEGG